MHLVMTRALHHDGLGSSRGAIRMAEFVMGGIVGSLGLQFLSPTPTFAASHTYDVLALYLTEDQWGEILFVLGLSRWLALWINGRFEWSRRITPTIRSGGAAFSAIVWALLLAGVFAANPGAAGVAIYPWLFVADALLAKRITAASGAAAKGKRKDAIS